MLEDKSDTELVELVKSGCQLSYEELIQRYSTKAFHLAVRLTRNQEDAEEVLHDAFVAVFKKIKGFEGKSQFSSWFYRITVNAALMKLRRRKPNQAISLEDISPLVRESWRADTKGQNLPDEEAVRTELQEVLEGAVSKLPDDYRTVFVLRDIDGLSNREVGTILSISTPAVKSRLHRARLMLRKRLQKFYDDNLAEDATREPREVANSK